MTPPNGPPLGFVLTQTAKAVSRAFDDAMAAAGGSLPTWLVLLSVRTQAFGNQRELADAIGIKAATLTHHLNGMEADGLLTRTRDPANRRVHRVELTDRGEELFRTLAATARAFDQRLRQGLDADTVAVLQAGLDRLRTNVTGP